MNILINYKIKEIRKGKGLSIRELSRKSGVSHTQISDIEKHKKDTTITTLSMLAIAMDVLPNELFDIEILDS